MTTPLDAWRHLLTPEGEQLLVDTAKCNRNNVKDIAKLRQAASLEEVSAALEVVSARHKAFHKFGELAPRLIADRQGVEQASSQAVARHKAKRFADVLERGGDVWDLCCGVGADTIALAAAGLNVTGVDISPLKAWMTEHNGGLAAEAAGEASFGTLQTQDADATEFQTEGRPFHLDPARRIEQGRVWKLDQYQPGPEAIAALLAQSPDACVKLSPGVDLEDVADSLDVPYEVEFVAERGRLVQTLLWTGRFMRAPRSATVLSDDGTAAEMSGEPGHIALSPAKRYLHAINPAIERADLIGALADELGAPAIHPKLGLLTSDEPIDSPFLTSFELLEQLPWREKKVKRWLDANDAGVIEVKTRGKVVNPDIVQQSLRGKGKTPYTVFVYRMDRPVVALICKRLAPEKKC